MMPMEVEMAFEERVMLVRAGAEGGACVSGGVVLEVGLLLH